MDENGKLNGLETEWIGSEPAANPREGGYLKFLRDPNVPDFWRLTVTDARHELDFNRMLRGSSPGVAYAFSTLVSPHSGPSTLILESAETARVLLNGKVIFEGGASGPAPQRIPITLEKGANRLLLKAVHGTGSWRIRARLLSQIGVYEELQVYPTGIHAEPPDLRAIRAIRSKKGNLDLDAAIEYDSASRFASQWAERFHDVALKPSVLENVIGEAARFVVSSQSQDADQISVALKKATKLVSAALSRSRAQVVVAAQHPKPLLRTNVAKEDYIRVAEGHRYFAHANGHPFPVLGFTLTLDSPDLYACNPVSTNYDPIRTDQYFAKLAKSGVNTLRIPLDAPGVDSFEDGSGKVSPEHMKWIDNLVLLAYKNGLKLLVSAYDSTRNLPSKAVTERMITIAGRESQIRRWKVMIDRWGSSGAVMGWEIFNEGDTAGGSPAQFVSALRQIATAVRTYEHSKWGRAHLLTSSTYSALPRGEIGDATFRNPTLDFAETHLFVGDSRSPIQFWAPAQQIANATAKCVVQTKSPYLDGELGPLDHPVADALSDSSGFANNAWMEFTSGASGAGLRRPYRVPDAPTDGMLDSVSSLHAFSLGVDWTMLSRPGGRRLLATPPRGWITNGFFTDKEAILWAGGPVDGDRIALPGAQFPAKGTYRAFDCISKRWIAKGSFNGSLPIPFGLRSVGFVLSK